MENVSLFPGGNMGWPKCSCIRRSYLDCQLHHSITLNIKGESYRLKEKRKTGVLAKSATPSCDDEMAESGQH